MIAEAEAHIIIGAVHEVMSVERGHIHEVDLVVDQVDLRILDESVILATEFVN